VNPRARGSAVSARQLLLWAAAAAIAYFAVQAG
jgi:hypothetical protein